MLHVVDFYGTVNVGKYTSPMDAMGMAPSSLKTPMFIIDTLSPINIETNIGGTHFPLP